MADGPAGASTVEIDGELIGRVLVGGADAKAAAGPAAPSFLTPGFIDLQVNGIGDIDVASAAGDDWGELDRRLLAHGVTAWCPTLVTAPLEAYDMPLRRIADAAARPDAGRPAILGAHLEGPFLGGAPGAHRRQHLAPIDLEWLAALPDIVRIVTLAPELPRALDAIELLTARGILVSLGHSTATFEQATAAVAAGARLTTHLFNGMGPLHHRQPGLVGAALSDDRVAASIICDLVHVHPAAVRTAFRAKGRGGAVLVTDAVGWEHGGDRMVVGADGAPRLRDGTLAGSALTMDAAIRNATTAAGVPVEDAVWAATAAPAAVTGDTSRGRLAAGRRADLVALTPELEVERVWIGGEVVWTPDGGRPSLR